MNRHLFSAVPSRESGPSDVLVRGRPIELQSMDWRDPIPQWASQGRSLIQVETGLDGKLWTKLPPIKYSCLGVRIYWNHKVSLDEATALRDALQSRAKYRPFRRFYGNALELDCGPSEFSRLNLHLVNKVERGLKLEAFRGPLRDGHTATDFSIETTHSLERLLTPEMLQLNSEFYDCGDLDREWLKSQYRIGYPNRPKLVVAYAKSQSKEIVGFAEVILNEPVENAALQRNTYVSPSWRGKGIGQALKTAIIEEICRSSKVEWILTHNDIDSEPLRCLSKRFGFVDLQRYIRIEGSL
jgi:GNAT superfamily N-acetyltransferase